MILCSIDSKICSSINLEFFNPRMKSTAGVVQIFSGLMVINALRMLPVMVKGFQFLSQVKVHMKSKKTLMTKSQDDIESDGLYRSIIENLIGLAGSLLVNFF